VLERDNFSEQCLMRTNQQQRAVKLFLKIRNLDDAVRDMRSVVAKDCRVSPQAERTPTSHVIL
jgi:hypothetical protein